MYELRCNFQKQRFPFFDRTILFKKQNYTSHTRINHQQSEVRYRFFHFTWNAR